MAFMSNFIKKVINLRTIINIIIQMWSYQNPPEPGSSSMKQWSDHELQLSKREYFRLQIRNRQIEQLKRQIRRKYNQLKDPNDYQLLRNINLSKCIAECKSYGINSSSVHEMFLYASSNSSAHLFELLDDRVLNILVENLLITTHENERETHQFQLKWNRQIFWILTNYTSYSKIIDNSFLQKLREIGRYIFQNSQKNIPFFDEAEQNIVLSLSNLIQKSKSCRYILQQFEQLLYIVINRFIETEERNSNLINRNLSYVPRIIFYFSQFFHNLYTTIQYEEIEKEKQKKCIKGIIHLLNSMLGQKFMSQEHKKLTLILIDSVTKIFGNSLDNHPELILFHKKQIKKMSEWFQKFIKTQSQSSRSDEIIVAYLFFLQVVYGPNIPEKYETYISQFFSKFFETHVGKVCTSMFKNKKTVFQNYTLCLLQPILMEEYLAELIFTEYLPIISYVFYHIQNSSYPLKKQALKCLINLIKSTIYDGSSTADHVLEILLANKVSDILALNLWAYVDTQLNQQLLSGIKIIIEAETNRYETKLNFWKMFTEAGGTLKFNKILQQSQSNVLKDEVNLILDFVRNCDEQI